MTCNYIEQEIKPWNMKLLNDLLEENRL